MGAGTKQLSWVLGLLVLAPGAAATTVLELDRARLVESASRILEGTVAEMRCGRDEHGRIVTRIALRVEPGGYLKGAGGARVEVVFPGGILERERRGMVIPGMPVFRTGERVLLFVAESPRGGLQLPVGLAQGKFEVRVDPVTGRRTLVRDLSGLSLVDPRTRRPVGGHPGRQEYDYEEWLQAIRRQVAGGRGR
jgi:hypothetical protein